MNIKALGDYVLIKKIGSTDKEVGGIVVPGSQQSLLNSAEILSIGDGEKITAMNLEVGDKVYYNEIEMNAVAVDGLQDGVYFVREDFLYGKQTN